MVQGDLVVASEDRLNFFVGWLRVVLWLVVEEQLERGRSVQSKFLPNLI